MEKGLKNIFSKKRMKYSGSFFILGFNTLNEAFLIGIIKKGMIVQIGSFTKGLKQNEKEILVKTILANQQNKENEFVMIKPSICVEVAFQSIEDNQLLRPTYRSFLFQQNWEECTWENLIINNMSLQNEIKITHPEKIIWSNPKVNKEMFLAYLAQISPFILPFLEKRLLTTIRYPQGISGESFFQKNCPDYAPKFINTVENDGNGQIICNDLSTLIWLGNQLAIEFHIPFQTIENNSPIEIVFDLDPPNKEAFPLAIKAAKEMGKIFDAFKIKSYPKLSGSKGLQIHIPIKHNTLTYNETRLFTSFIANYLVEKFPNDFTIERFKKNRGGRLYLDYVQHAEGKTIICPYSTRAKELPTVAVPLYWNEITDELKIENYIMETVLNRLTNGNCPMNDYFEQENPSLYDVINSLKENKNMF